MAPTMRPLRLTGMSHASDGCASPESHWEKVGSAAGANVTTPPSETNRSSTSEALTSVRQVLRFSALAKPMPLQADTVPSRMTSTAALPAYAVRRGSNSLRSSDWERAASSRRSTSRGSPAGFFASDWAASSCRSSSSIRRSSATARSSASACRPCAASISPVSSPRGSNSPGSAGAASEMACWASSTSFARLSLITLIRLVSASTLRCCAFSSCSRIFSYGSMAPPTVRTPHYPHPQRSQSRRQPGSGTMLPRTGVCLPAAGRWIADITSEDAHANYRHPTSFRSDHR